MKLLNYELTFKKREKRNNIDVNNDLYGKTYTGETFLSGADKIGSIKVTETTALKLSAVWACVKIKANQLATLPYNFYKRDNEGNSIIADNNAQRIIKYPNAFMTAFDFKFTMMAAKLLHGNGYARIVRNKFYEITELIPIHPNRVEPVIKENRLIYKIDGDIEMDADDILHFKGMTIDGLVGMSPIQYEAQNLGLALASQNELKNFYEKGSKIPGFVSYPNKIETLTKSKSEEALQKKIAGTSPTTQVPIFDNGAKYIPVGVNPAEALWLEMMGYGVIEICRIFGVPPHLVASLERSTNNNIEHQGMDFVNHGLLPEAKCFEEEADKKLLREDERFNYYSKFNMNGLLRGDSAARAALYQALHNTGAINANEIRRLEEMNGYDGGDKYFIQLNQIDITKSTEYYMNEKQTETERMINLIKNGKKIIEQ